MPNQTELASALRAWRDRVTPAEVGLPSDGRRRATGLRREELAALAGLSVDYLVRLEQGRSANPSPHVLAALARALRLSDAERDLLYQSAGIAPPSANVISRHISPGVQRVLDRLQDTPVGVYTVSWDLVLANPLLLALTGEQGPTERDRNLIWRIFIQDDTTFFTGSAQSELAALRMVSDLHGAAARYPKDRELADLIRDLLAGSEAFSRLWSTYAIEPHPSATTKTLRSPTVGLLTLDCDILATLASDLRIIVFTARPGTEDAEKIDRLRVTGLQLV